MSTFHLNETLPKESELAKLLAQCDVDHDLHLHELNDGALKMMCFNCPFNHVLGDSEETAVRQQMDAQEKA